MSKVVVNLDNRESIPMCINRLREGTWFEDKNGYVCFKTDYGHVDFNVRGHYLDKDWGNEHIRRILGSGIPEVK